MFKIFYGLVFVLCAGVTVNAQQNKYVSFRNIETSGFRKKNILHQVWMEDGSFWAKTESGIIHHNGFSGKEFLPEGNSEGTIISADIGGLHKFSDEEIWIDYRDTNVLTKFNPLTEKFIHYQLDELMTDGELTSVIVRVKKDHEGQIWLCTWGSGLIQFNEGKEPNKVYIINEDEAVKERTGRFIKDMVIEDDNTFFVTFFDGPSGELAYPGYFDPATESFERLDVAGCTGHLSEMVQKQVEVAIKIVHFVHKDSIGNYWLGTYSGLLHYDVAAKEINRVSENGEDPTILNQVNIHSYVVSDRHLWIATLNRGVMVVDINTREVVFHYSDPVNSGSLYSNKIYGVNKDPFGNLWIANGTGMLSVYVPFLHNFKVLYWKDMELEYSNRSAQNIPVNQFYVHDSKHIYVSSRPGVLCYDYKTMTLSKRYDFQGIKNKFKENRGISHFKINGDKVFMNYDNLPAVYDLVTGQLNVIEIPINMATIAFRHDPKVQDYYLLVSNWEGTRVVHMSEDLQNRELIYRDTSGNRVSETFSFLTNNGNWIVSESLGRFMLINPEDSVLTVFSPSKKESYFPDSLVTCALVQSGNEILIGTQNGLYTFNEVTYAYENISEKVGLKEAEGVNAMIKDDHGRVWMSLSTELHCWNPNTNEYQRYGSKLGVAVGDFLPAVAQKDELGNLYFVSMNGILIFNPDDVQLPQDELKLFLSSASVNEQKLEDAEMTELLRGDKTFSWTENYFEFYFHTNQVFELSPHQFEYKLEGLNQRWISSGNTNHIRFDNLQYGQYKLQFRATNAYGVESQIYEIKFKISKPFWRTAWFMCLVVILLGLIVYLAVKGRLKALKKRGELLEKTVEERTAEVVEQKQEAERQKAEAEHQKELVEEKQKEITDSIVYAKRIQDAIMPSQDLISQYLPESFVMYRPKDIVAGDFYWMEPLSDHEVILAVADCTGHGVPGAMVSVVCNNALNRTVREFKITDPGKLLDSVKDLVVAQFDKSATVVTDNQQTIKDGMDISICYINKKTMQMLWAGANNPLWIIRNNELIEIKGNKQPVGQFEPSEAFTTHTIEIQPNDQFYLFSDGYADQFGGDKGKKFKSSSLKQLFMDIHQEPAKMQHQRIERSFDLWKGDYEQLDDVCVIGVRV